MPLALRLFSHVFVWVCVYACLLNFLTTSVVSFFSFDAYTHIYKFPTCVRQAYVFVGMQRVYFFMPSNSVVQYNEPTLNKSNNIETTTKILHPYYTYSINQLAKWFSLRLKKTVTWKTPVVTMTELTVLSFCCYSVHPLIFCCLQACERYCNVLVLESVFVCVSISAIPKKD